MRRTILCAFYLIATTSSICRHKANPLPVFQHPKVTELLAYTRPGFFTDTFFDCSLGRSSEFCYSNQCLGFRCHPEQKGRFIFNFIHGFFGIGCWLCAGELMNFCSSSHHTFLETNPQNVGPICSMED